MTLLLLSQTTSITDILSIVFSFLALIVAIFIPEKIKWEQTYSTLLAEYKSYDFAAAVQGVVEFFTERCNKDVTKIKTEYENLIKEYSIKLNNGNPISNEQNLHFQRRLLTTFFWQLEQCSKSIFIRKRRVKRDFTSNEANIAKVVYFMNQAVSKSEILFKDLKICDLIPKAENVKGINSSVVYIYELLKKEPKFIR